MRRTKGGPHLSAGNSKPMTVVLPVGSGNLMPTITFFTKGNAGRHGGRR
jgi:hypothetical protein